MRKTALDAVHDLARRDSRIVFIGSDLGAGTLDGFRRDFPDRYFMEGVAEQNIIGMAAGLAMNGFIPYINTISTFFTRRAFEQIAVDLCLHRLPVRLIASGGGLVYAPLGPTHLATEDLAAMRSLPGMAVLAPCDAPEMGRMMEHTLNWPGPIYIRLAKGGDRVVSSPDRATAIGPGLILRQAGEVNILTTGIGAQRALDAAQLLESQGIAAGVAHFPTVKPLDEALVLDLARRSRLLVTLEEHSLIGGLGSAIGEVLLDRGPHPLPRVLRLGLPDAFPKDYGSQESLLEGYGLAPAAIARSITAALV